ncbi:HAD family phosphatase [Eubacterium sp. 1001713B170207_170306_E7]|uniref:HAD family hydrolase n=1 Tax=Eubacterium sp. 1001713B170207_170306_E7 TaxID=2787097 RepID=UPI001897CBDF|nr:HAD family phosphatase [Eubacterium sp. 1001713B170207_170306_E7]
MTEAIIFDMDGLMFDTETISIPSWVKAGEILGYPITEAMIYELFGMNPVAVNAYWKERFGEAFDCGAAMKLHLDYMEDYVRENGVPLKPGLIALLDYLKAQGYRYTIASSTQRPMIKMYLERAGISHYFKDDIVGGDEITNGKPAPDIYLKAADKLGVSPERCMVFEDSLAGIESAWRAGMKPVMVPDKVPADQTTEARLYAMLETLDEAIGLLKKES